MKTSNIVSLILMVSVLIGAATISFFGVTEKEFSYVVGFTVAIAMIRILSSGWDFNFKRRPSMTYAAFVTCVAIGYFAGFNIWTIGFALFGMMVITLLTTPMKLVPHSAK